MSETKQHLAQLNIGRLRYEANDPRMADFIDNLAFVNGLAERSDGFVWRYQDDSGSAIDTRPFDGDPRMAVNLSVWEGVEALEKFVWQTVHKRFYGQPPRMVRDHGRELFRDVVGAGRTPPHRQGGDRTARSPEAQRAERPRLRLGKPAGGKTVEDGALRLRRSDR